MITLIAVVLIFASLLPAGGLSVNGSALDSGALFPVASGKTLAPMALHTENGVAFAATPRAPKGSRPVPPDAAKAGRLVFTFDAPQKGLYATFARVFWHDGASNSFWISPDGAPAVRLGNDGQESAWISIKGPSFRLDSGRHAITIRERESGARLASLFIIRVDSFISENVRFSDSLLVSDTARLLVDPPFALSDTTEMTVRLFLADTGKAGILAEAPPLPFSLGDEKNRVLIMGKFRPGELVTIRLPKPPGKQYRFLFGRFSYVWRNFTPDLAFLRAETGKLRSSPSPVVSQLILPSLALCERNILRGSRYWRQDEKDLPNIPYIEEQIRAGRTLLAAAKSGRPPSFSAAQMELAYYSPVDSVLCPFVFYLPAGHARLKKRPPFVMFLHGSGGTQWGLERTLQAGSLDIRSLKMPGVFPHYRGDPDLNDTVKTDLDFLISMIGTYYSLDTNQVVMSGFSRGGYFTWWMAYDHPSRYRALVPIAGGNPKLWDKKGPAELSFPEGFRGKVLILHSPEDLTVPIEEDYIMQKVFQKAYPEMIHYPGGHIIPKEILEYLNRFAE